VREQIGDLPRGRGILGVLIRDATPLRLADIGGHPQSVGFPPNHPPMRTFLGVPLMVRGVAYGNLYFTEKEGGAEFTEEDEELVNLLAGQAAVAIENARLYESATRWSRQLESLNEISAAMSTETDVDRVLDLVATHLRELVGARVAMIALLVNDGYLVIRAAAGEYAEELRGHRLPGSGSKLGRVLERGRSERIDSLIDDVEADQKVGRRLQVRTGLFVPLFVRDRPIGGIVLHDKEGDDARFTDEDVRLAEIFAPRVATAVDLSERVARDALRRVVAAQELERKRLARELHDETGQALTSILLGLKAVEGADSGAHRETVAHLREQVKATLQDVRRLAVELRPSTLDDFGLVPALQRLVDTFTEQTGITVQLEAPLGEERLPEEVETTLYRMVQEALTNVVKHAQARTVSVVVRRRNGTVTAVVEDDGRGYAGDGGQGLGLVGMRERADLVNGRLSIESRPGAGTTLSLEVPLP
jgi:signal transduction histidine kinase